MRKAKQATFEPEVPLPRSISSLESEAPPSDESSDNSADDEEPSEDESDDNDGDDETESVPEVSQCK